MKIKRILLLAAFLSISAAKAQLVNVDPTFGNNGIAAVDFGNTFEAAVTSTMQTDGKIILCGTVGFASDSRISLARLLPNGLPDLSFGESGKKIITYDSQWGHIPRQVAVQSDGKILISFLLNENNETRRMLVRLQANGDLDTGFGQQGYYKTSWERGEGWTGFKILSDGKILCYGTNSELFDGLYYGRVIAFRLLANGQLDASFNGPNYRVYRLRSVGASRENALFLGAGSDQSDVIYASSQNPVGGATTNYLLRIKPNGFLDSTFGTNGVQTFSFPGSTVTVTGVLVTGTGSIRMPGMHRQNTSSIQTPVVYGIRANGKVDSTFGENGLGRYFLPNTSNFGQYIGVDVKTDAQGRFYLGYAGNSEQSTSRVFAVARLLPTGLPDLTYGQQGSVTTSLPGTPQRLHLDLSDGLPIMTGQTNLSSIAQGDDMIALKIKQGAVSVQDVQAGLEAPYPNPLRSGEWLILPSKLSGPLFLSDLSGKRIEIPVSPSIDQENRTRIRLPQLQPGTYFLQTEGHLPAIPIQILP
jgi:uncharacterized delta-60 repeat protein